MDVIAKQRLVLYGKILTRGGNCVTIKKNLVSDKSVRGAAMEKVTKNKIDRAYIARELSALRRGIRRYSIGAFFVLLPFFVPVTVFAVLDLVSSLGSLGAKIVWGFLAGALLSSPLWLMLVLFFISLKERRMITRGAYFVVKRTLSFKDETLVNRRLVRRLHFPGFSPFAVGSRVYEFSFSGEEFYVVHYLGSKEIKLIYSTQIYEYSDL